MTKKNKGQTGAQRILVIPKTLPDEENPCVHLTNDVSSIFYSKVFGVFLFVFLSIFNSPLVGS